VADADKLGNVIDVVRDAAKMSTYELLYKWDSDQPVAYTNEPY
jgi:hypothetical protein